MGSKFDDELPDLRNGHPGMGNIPVLNLGFVKDGQSTVDGRAVNEGGHKFCGSAFSVVEFFGY